MRVENKDFYLKTISGNKEIVFYPAMCNIETQGTNEQIFLSDRLCRYAMSEIWKKIQKNNMNFISISGQFSESFNLSIASRNDEAILNEILQKALLSIDDKHKLEFSQKWNNINYQTKINNQLIIQILFFTIVFISIFIYLNLRLKEEIKSKE